MPEDFWIITGVFILMPLLVMAPFIIASDIGQSRRNGKGGLREYYFKGGDGSDSSLAYIGGLATVSVAVGAFLSRAFEIFRDNILIGEVLANNLVFNTFLLLSGGTLVAFSVWRLKGVGLGRKELFWVLLIWTLLLLVGAADKFVKN